MTHIVAGYPSLKESEKIAMLMCNSGVDFIEIQNSSKRKEFPSNMLVVLLVSVCTEGVKRTLLEAKSNVYVNVNWYERQLGLILSQVRDVLRTTLKREHNPCNYQLVNGKVVVFYPQ